MISDRLLRSVCCVNPECIQRWGTGTSLTRRWRSALQCPRCESRYRMHPAGYIELMPPERGQHTSLYVSQEAEFDAALDYKRIGIPLLGAAVRQRAIREMLKPTAQDRLIELGCGNGKFVFWNRKTVEWAVGVDPAPLFAREALQGLDLCLSDARVLPFPDGTFTAAMSIDVLEHLPLEDIRAFLSEANRVLDVRGRLFLFSNTREGSRLDFIVRSVRRLSRWLGERGVLDDTRDRLRKSDHVKALETYPDLERVLRECGFRVEKAVFWNGLFQSIIENLVVKLAESAMRRVKATARTTTAHTGEGGGGEDAMRRDVKQRLARRGPEYKAMMLLTRLMWLDLVLFGSWRAGPYFVLARKVGGEVAG
ncbi:MAG: methyltransferase domain-containing protein [Chloroflexota bacterium]|nr:methyltransferase domain-containing protein [Chloroflexota bacterium]